MVTSFGAYPLLVNGNGNRNVKNGAVRGVIQVRLRTQRSERKFVGRTEMPLTIFVVYNNIIFTESK